jgi:hypothetical protein
VLAMAEVGTLEYKIHVTAIGIPELEHLLEVLKANIDNLPTIIVRAMEALAESDLSAPRNPKIEIAPIVISGGICAEEFKSALRSNDHAKAVE